MDYLIENIFDIVVLVLLTGGAWRLLRFLWRLRKRPEQSSLTPGLRAALSDPTRARELATALGDVLPLATLGPADADELVAQMGIRMLDAAEVLYQRGDPAEDVFVVQEGFVKSVLHDEQGRELELVRYGRGDIFGVFALFEKRARESTIVALVPTTVLQVSGAGVRAVLARNPRATSFLFERMAGMIAQLSDRLEARAFLDARGRLARYLIDLPANGGVPLRQQDIAAAIGADVFNVNKLLREFERRGLVHVARERVQVLDADGLGREIHT